MKKLVKITISPEKIMENEELINLQGGYDPLNCCFCPDSGIINASDENECHKFCRELDGHLGHWMC